MTLMQRARPGPHRPRLHLLRPSRHRQDHHRAHPGHGAELPQPHRLRRAPHRRALRGLRVLHRNPRRQRRRRHRDRRRHQSRHRRDPRAARRRPLPPRARQVQDLHPRRGPPDYRRRLQCPAEDAGRAARAHRLHDGHHPARGLSPDRPLALPALQLPRRQARRHHGPAPLHRRRRRRLRGRNRALAARRGRRRLHARRPLHHGPGHRQRAHRGLAMPASTPPRFAS